MKPIQVPIRRIGNSRGVVIPKPLLHQAGLEDTVDLILEGDAIVLRKPAKPVRAGWAEASRAIAERGDDVLVMGEFANEEDLGSTW